MATTDVDPGLASDLTPARGADDDLRDLAGGALVVFLGKLARISRGAFIWVITLLCGADVQGLYSTAWAVCSTLNKVARFGLLRGVVLYVTAARSGIDHNPRDENTAIAAGYLIAAVASGVVVAAQLLVADRIAAFYDRPIAEAIRIMAFTAPFVALSWVLTSATRALRIMRYEVYVRSVGGPLLLFVGGTAIGLAGLGLEAIAWVQLTMAVGNLLLAAHFFRRHFSLRQTLAAVGTAPWRPMARFCLPVTLADLIYALLVQLDVLMLARYVDMTTVGLYVIARRLASTVLKAPQAFDAIFSAIVSELTVQGRQEELGDRFVAVARWILTVNLPIAVCLVLLGDTILLILGSRQLEGLQELELALQVLLVLCAGMMVQSVFAVAEPLLAMSGRPGVNFVNNALWLAVNFALNLWLIDAYGAIGAAVGASVSMGLVNLLRIGEVYLFSDILPVHRSHLKPLVAAAVAALPTWWLRDPAAGLLWRVALPALAFLAVYGVGLAVLRPELEDRLLLARLKRGVGRRLRRG